VELRVFLADSVESGQGGKVSALGLGWKLTSSPTGPMALVLIIDLESDEAAKEHSIVLRLVHAATSEAATMGLDREAPPPLTFGGTFRTGPTDDAPSDLPARATIGVMVGAGLPLEPGLYRWDVDVDDRHEPGWSETFFVRPASDHEDPVGERPRLPEPTEP
jgi:hypothetical protein